MDRMGRIFTPSQTPTFAGAGFFPIAVEGAVIDGD